MIIYSGKVDSSPYIKSFTVPLLPFTKPYGVEIFLSSIIDDSLVFLNTYR